LVVAAARPSVGKTAWAVGLALNVAEQGVPVLVVSLEQSRWELAERLLCVQSGVDGQRLRLGVATPGELAMVRQAAGQLRSLPIHFDDSPVQGMLQVMATARRLSSKKRIGLIVVDYLQLVAPEDRRAPRQEQVAQISRRLKWLAREVGVPVVALAQLNRGVEDRQDQRPRLSDLRESGAIEQDADTVVLLHRPPDQQGQAEQTIDFLVAKQRNGPVGEATLLYRRSCLRFENYNPGGRFYDGGEEYRSPFPG
jgi:replicative DNA helicase